MKRLLAGILLTNLVADVPAWFAKPSISPSKLYGMGVGENPQISKQNAILDLTCSLQTNVKSTFEKQTQRSGNVLSSSAREQINLGSNAIDLSGVEVIRSECQKKQCYTQVELDKATFLSQLKQRIQALQSEFNKLQSPFDYPYKKNILFPKILSDHALYVGLGGEDLQIVDHVGDVPVFSLRFEYEGEFSPILKNAFEQALRQSINQFGAIADRAEWEIIVKGMQEGKIVNLGIEVISNHKIIHSTSVYDTQKESVSTPFFAKRLATQVSKAMQEWGKTQTK